MNSTCIPTLSARRGRLTRQTLAAVALALCACASQARAGDGDDGARGIEQALTAAMQDKRGITLYVQGQTIAGAVTRVEPGRWVEMRNQQSGRIVVRIERIDGIAAP